MARTKIALIGAGMIGGTLAHLAAMRQMGDSAAKMMIMAPLLRSSTLKKGLLGTALTAGIVAFFNRR